jgi:hypothetical protein
MKFLRLVFAVATLAPSLVCAQDQQFSDCRTLALAGNFVASDEVLLNGLVCKVVKSKRNSAASPQAVTKPAERSSALLGIIEPEVLRSKEKAGTTPAGAEPGPAAVPGSVSSDSRAAAGPPSSSFGIPNKSLGEIARAYRNEAATQMVNDSEGDLEQNRPGRKAEPVAPPSNSHTTPTGATVAQPVSARSTQPLPVAQSPGPLTTKPERIAAAPATISTTAATAPPTRKQKGIVARQVSHVRPSLAKQHTSPPAAAPVLAPALKPETNLQAMGVTSASTPEVQPPTQTSALAVAQTQRTPAGERTAVTSSTNAKEDAPEPKPEPSFGVGSFTAPGPTTADPPTESLANAVEEDALFREGQASSCHKNVSLGSMEKDKLFLAMPDWALQWYEKNQKRFPGICFSDSPMPGARNYLVVFYLAVPQAAGTESLTRVSAPGQATSGSGKGSFTTSYGFTWHYTYEGTVTTTITSVSAENAPHNQPSTLRYATAYSEQGIPVSQHSPTTAAKQVKETAYKSGKSGDAELPQFHEMAGLLNRLMEDIAKR